MSGYLIDTNVLVRLVLPHDPLSPVATAVVDELKRRGQKASVASQNVVEFWSVATRPVSVNGLGMLPDKVATEVHRIEKMFRVLDDVASAYKRWRGLSERMPCAAARSMMPESWRPCWNTELATS